MTLKPPASLLSWLLVVSLAGCSLLPATKRKPSPTASQPVRSPIQLAQIEEEPSRPEPGPQVAQAEVTPPAPPTAPQIQPPTPPPPQVAQPAQAPQPVPPTPLRAQQAQGRFVVLNFDNADVEVVIHAASEIVGFNYVLGPDVRAKVTVQTSQRIPQEEVFNVLLAILEVHGLTAVRSGNLYKIVRIAAARERPVPTVVGNEPDPHRTGDEVVTQIIPLRFASVVDVGNLLRSLISRDGNLIIHRETNLLIITDSASNIRRLLQILTHLDLDVALNELQILPVKFADAVEIAGILNQLFAGGRLRPAQVPGVPVPPTPALAPGQPPPPRPAAPEVSPGAERPPLIVAERRSNALIVHARKNEMELIRKLIGQLDVDIYGGKRVFVYYAENAKAKDLAATLNAIYGREAQPRPVADRPPTTPAAPGTTQPAAPRTTPAPRVEAVAETGELGLVEGEVKFVADETTNALIVTTFPRNWQQIEETIKKLDRMPKQVLIEVLVAEITLSDELSLGVEWAIKGGAFKVEGEKVVSDVSQSATTTLAGRPAFSIPGGGATLPGFTFFAFSDKVLSLINALAKDNRLNVLSSPSILTSENKKATINVSRSIPIVTTQTTPTAGAAGVATNTVEYKDAGIVLTVTPRIGEKRTVALDIKQEVNDIGGPQLPTNSPIIIKREVDTSVVIADGQTLIMGGLIQTNKTFDQTGIPFLNKIPLFGLLFGSTTSKLSKTELVILITPRVVGTPEEGKKLTEEMRQRTPDLKKATEDAPKTPSAPPSK